MKNFAIQGICDKFAVQPAKARVAELVDALDSKSCVLNRRAGSSPASGTQRKRQSIDFQMVGVFCIRFFPTFSRDSRFFMKNPAKPHGLVGYNDSCCNSNDTKIEIISQTPNLMVLSAVK